MSTFHETIEHLALYIEQAEGAVLLIGVCDDTVLRDHAVQILRQRLSAGIVLDEFRYDAEHLSLLEGAMAATTSGHGRPAVSVTGLELLPRDQRTEAIKLLDLQRNRLGQTHIAVLLWVNRATLADISTTAADFYSWRSAALFLEPPPGWDVLASMQRSYLQALAAHNAFVNMQGLAPMRGGQIVQMRMEDIFIPLQAEQEAQPVDMPWRLRRAQEEGADEIGESSAGVLSLAEREGMLATRAHEPQLRSEVKPRRIIIPDLLQERRAVVLGDPGAGKTTLLRYVSYVLAHGYLSGTPLEMIQGIPDLAAALPVYVRIGEYAQYLQRHPETSIEAFAPIGCQMRQLPLTDELLQHAMGRGHTFFLLDGLDEIIDAGQRRAVAQCVEQFVRLHPQCRVLVTSRIVGYREAQLSKEFVQCTICPFEDTEISHFAQQWYNALGMPDRAEGLTQAIQESPSIRRLATNPLLLTVIALMHYRGTKLPRHRVRLYRDAAETLVDQWMSHRRVNPEGWDTKEAMDVLLPAIAWHMHHTTSSGLIGEEELYGLLVETLRQDDAHISESEARTRATQFLHNVSEFSGIFLERGLDQNDRSVYGFLHLTFEEYFAALRLAEQWKRAGKDFLKPLLHHPRWTEILLLTAGHFGESSQYDATQFVRHLLQAQSAYENILHRDLLMAARSLADDIRVEAELRRTILSQLLKVYFTSTSPSTLQEDIRQICSRLGDTVGGTEMAKGLSERLGHANEDVRRTAARALGQLGAAVATPDVLAGLLRCLTDAEWLVRRVAAEALGQRGAAYGSPPAGHSGLAHRLCVEPAPYPEALASLGTAGEWGLLAGAGVC